MRNRSETRESKHIRLPFLFAIHPLKSKHNKSTLSTGRVAAGDTSKFANARSFLLMERNLNVEKATTLHPTNNLNTNSSDNSRSPVPFARCPTQNKVSHAYPLDERFSTPVGQHTQPNRPAWHTRSKWDWFIDPSLRALTVTKAAGSPLGYGPETAETECTDENRMTDSKVKIFPGRYTWPCV